jgi:hypothetical protein
MPTDFQEFLRQKSQGTGNRERNRNRSEWLKALEGLLTQIEDCNRTHPSSGDQISPSR